VVRRREGKAQPSEDDIIAVLRKDLANYKVPKRVYFVDELPRNSMGKVQKTVLRDRLADTFTTPQQTMPDGGARRIVATDSRDA